MVGGIKALVKSPILVISEGYATAATLSQTLGFATVAAFDSGNLVSVAKELHAKYPEKQIIIAGDDDNKHLELTHGINPGRSKAEEAARAVGWKSAAAHLCAERKYLPGRSRTSHTAQIPERSNIREATRGADENKAVHRFQRPCDKKRAGQRRSQTPAVANR